MISHRPFVCLSVSLSRVCLSACSVLSGCVAAITMDWSLLQCVSLYVFLCLSLSVSMYACVSVCSVVWLLYVCLTALHLYANYRAVSAVRMDTFNQSRLHIVISHWLTWRRLLTVAEANQREPILTGLSVCLCVCNAYMLCILCDIHLLCFRRFNVTVMSDFLAFHSSEGKKSTKVLHISYSML